MANKLGRRRPVGKAQRFHLARYIRTGLPMPPSAVDYSPKARASLSRIMGNDQLGDCVIAGANHAAGVFTGNAGNIYVPSDAQIIAEYSAIGGYRPGDPSTDNGSDEDTAIVYYTTHGFGNGTKLLGSLRVGVDANSLRIGVWLFEAALLCAELPDPWLNVGASGFVWDVAGDSNPNNGHAFTAVGYTTWGLIVSTWGMLGTLTWAAASRYCSGGAGGSANVVLSPDQVARGQALAGNGVAWQQVVADFDALGGNVPIPAPPPVPPAPPAPTPGTMVLTLAQAQKRATRDLQASAALFLTKNQAIRLVDSSLAAGWGKP